MEDSFRKNLLIASRVLALLLILSIFFIGFVQINYVKDINEIKQKYGDNAYCYLCGLESGKICSCNYIPKYSVDGRINPDFDLNSYLENLAYANSEECKADFSLSKIKNEKKINISLSN